MKQIDGQQGRGQQSGPRREGPAGKMVDGQDRRRAGQNVWQPQGKVARAEQQAAQAEDVDAQQGVVERARHQVQMSGPQINGLGQGPMGTFVENQVRLPGPRGGESRVPPTGSARVGPSCREGRLGDVSRETLEFLTWPHTLVPLGKRDLPESLSARGTYFGFGAFCADLLDLGPQLLAGLGLALGLGLGIDGDRHVQQDRQLLDRGLAGRFLRRESRASQTSGSSISIEATCSGVSSPVCVERSRMMRRSLDFCSASSWRPCSADSNTRARPARRRAGSGRPGSGWPKADRPVD